MIKTRVALLNEWEAVADITKIANDQYAEEMDSDFFHDYEESTRTMLLTETGVWRLLAQEDEIIVGSVIYCPPYERVLAGKLVKNPYPEFRLLSVLPKHRNKGIANILIVACEERARNDGEEAITLHTTRFMTVAKAMYERRGYKRYDTIDFEPVKGFTVMGYKKQLNNSTEAS